MANLPASEEKVDVFSTASAEETSAAPFEMTEEDHWVVPDEPEIEELIDPAALDSDEDAEQGEEPEGEPEPEPETEEAVEPSHPEVDVTDPSTLPEELRGLWKKTDTDMKRGFHGQMQKFAESRKAADAERQAAETERLLYQQKLEALTHGTASQDDGPPVPTADMAAEEQARLWDQRLQWHAQQQAEKYNAQLMPHLQQQAQQMQVLDAERDYVALRSWEGYTPEVEQRMAMIASESPLYEQALLDPQYRSDAMKQLFIAAKAVEGSQQAVTKSVARKAGAKKASVSRGRMRGSSAVATPGKRYGESLDDVARKVCEDFGIPYEEAE